MSSIRRHWVALAFAFVVGCITVAPVVLAPLSLGSDYRGIQYMPHNDEDVYRAYIQDVLDGHVMLRSPLLFEYKDSAPLVIFPINEWAYAVPALAIGLSATVVASKFILPAALFFLVYLLARRLLGEEGRLAELTAIAAGLVVVLGASFVDYAYMQSFFHGKALAPPIWTRLVNPIMGGIELFAFLLALHAVWERRRFASIAAGVLLASTVGYFFAFALALAVFGILFLTSLLRREFSIAKELIGAFIISSLLDIPFWYNSLTSLGGEAGRALAMRNGMFFTHQPVINKALLLGTLVVGSAFVYIFRYRRPNMKTRSWLFMAALIVASWVAFNQQVITGREIWYQHFVQYTVPLITICLFAATYFLFRERFARLLCGGMLTLIVLTLAYGAVTVGSFVHDGQWFKADQRYGTLMTWFNTHAAKDCVVLEVQKDLQLERTIPAYTACNVYDTAFNASGVPEDRIVRGFLLNMRLKGVEPEDAETYLAGREDDVRLYFFRDWNDLYEYGTAPWVEEMIRKLATSYRSFVTEPLEGQIRKYRIDYVVSDGPLPIRLTRELPHLHRIATSGVYDIYAF